MTTYLCWRESKSKGTTTDREGLGAIDSEKRASER